jgi:putative SOS response-associated peptidase YedK
MTLTLGDLDALADELAAVLEVEARAQHRPRYNLAPSQPHLLLRLGEADAQGRRRRLGPALWGFPQKGPRPKFLVNARAETAASRPSFRDAFGKRRCVIPADGFYEWRAGPDGKRPIWFHRPDGGLLALAGLYEELPGAGGVPERRFVVLTTTPNALVAKVHDRMPALLAPDDIEAWLRAPAPRLLRPAPEDLLVATPVSRRVNAVAHDDAGCLRGEPDAGGDAASGGSPAPPRQLTLF